MTLAISDDHKALADTVIDFCRKHDVRAMSRALLETNGEPMPSFWGELAGLGWLGLHVPEANGGSGYTLEELVIVAEQFGRAGAPGPFIPSVIASAVLSAAPDSEAAARYLGGLADGSIVGAAALSGNVTVAAGKASGDAGAVLGGGLANILLVGAGDGVAVVDLGGAGVTIESPKNLDPTRRSVKITLAGAPATVVAGARDVLRDLARIVLSAEAVGVAEYATESGAEYAKHRLQFGRVIAMYQGVKHHCANMAVAMELAKAATWDAARAARLDADTRGYTAAVAATLAGTAADLCANLSTQVHGGIAITWEHDAHLAMRRATTLRRLLDDASAARDVTAYVRKGVKRARTVELPSEAESMRAEIRAVAQNLAALGREERSAKMIETGYVMPHWPKPWGLAAQAVEQLLIEEEFTAAGVKRPQYGITAWNILTIIDHGTEDQKQRWVPSALRQEVIWCQLFSEPDAGSDAAGIKTKATRVDGGWLVNGQKVWTSGAHYSGRGFATVRTNPDVPKHQGITMMVIDMHAEGVEVRPLKQTSGASEFNEVFFNDVFVPDDDVVGPVDGGWTVARATLGNESVSIGSGESSMTLPAAMLIAAHDAHPDRLPGGEVRIGRYASHLQAMSMLNLRSTHRAVIGGGPGPEGAMTKLILSEIGHDAADMYSVLNGTDSLFLEGEGEVAGVLTLMHRGMSIAGGTSEIKRNQIGERILGLPRDPLLM